MTKPKTTIQKSCSDYLIDHWSVSAVSEFIRNEKSFERKYIFGIKDKQMSLSQIIGLVYHKALMAFFQKWESKDVKMSYDELTLIAHNALDRIGADRYRPQLKKTIAQLQQEALQCINFALKSFLSEINAYESVIKKIVFVEEPLEVDIRINGVKIPVPLKVVPDVVFIHKDGTLGILDHKTKKTWSTEKDIVLRYGNQAVTYSMAFERYIEKFPDALKECPQVKKGVNHFFFYENKFTKNRNGARQIKQIPINLKESRPLLEQVLFEGVSRMMEAVGDPDYVYLMNPHDFFQDAGEMTEFWVKTHVEGLEGFPNLKPRVKALLAKKRSKIRRSALTGVPKSVIKSFKNPTEFISYNQKDMENLTIAEKIEHRLRTFNCPVSVEHKVNGYSCDTYLLKVSVGVKTSSIFGYRLDIANAIGAKDVRVVQELVEYMNDVYVAIEVKRKDHIFISLNERKEKAEHGVFAIGRDNFDMEYCWDVNNPSTPHLMISGASGSGKSFAIRTLIEQAQSMGIALTILDPKREFVEFSDIAKVLHEQEDIELEMAAKVEEMDKIFKTHGATGNTENKQLIIFDEAADCFARQSRIKDFNSLEKNTLILSQKARSAGIHLVLAAQRFSVKVLTGDAKANFPTRLCLTVSKAIDSKVMLDVEGAEKLVGKGDALITSPSIGEPVRIQCYSPSK